MFGLCFLNFMRSWNLAFSRLEIAVSNFRPKFIECFFSFCSIIPTIHNSYGIFTRILSGLIEQLLINAVYIDFADGNFPDAD
jgi:hypothetical protein